MNKELFGNSLRMLELTALVGSGALYASYIQFNCCGPGLWDRVTSNETYRWWAFPLWGVFLLSLSSTIYLFAIALRNDPKNENADSSSKQSDRKKKATKLFGAYFGKLNPHGIRLGWLYLVGVLASIVFMVLIVRVENPPHQLGGGARYSKWTTLGWLYLFEFLALMLIVVSIVRWSVSLNSFIGFVLGSFSIILAGLVALVCLSEVFFA